MRNLAISLLLFMVTPLFSGDYDALVAAMKKNWSFSTIGVVCDLNASKSSVTALQNASVGLKIFVMDVKGPQDMGKALAALTGHKPDAVVLIAGDKVAGDGTSAATFIIQRMASNKVPTLATTEAGVKQGAILGVTGGKLMTNLKMVGAIGITAPAGAINTQ